MKTLSDLISYLNDRDCRYLIIPSMRARECGAEIVVFNKATYDMKMSDIELINNNLFVPFIEVYPYGGNDDRRWCVLVVADKLSERNAFNVVSSEYLERCLDEIGA